MSDFARNLTVEFVEPGLGETPRSHAILADLAGEGREVLHLWTSDPALAADIVRGAKLAISIVPDRRYWLVFRTQGQGMRNWLATCPTTGEAIDWTSEEERAARFYGHDIALDDARLCAAAGHTVAVVARG